VNSHVGHDIAAKNLVEEVDVDLAELLLKSEHRFNADVTSVETTLHVGVSEE
jgi:hypothetical protein